MTNKLRWGLLSTARINDALIEPIRRATRSDLVGVASRSQAKVEAYAREKGIPKTYGSYEAMLADPEIDAVYNPLPNALHCEWTVKAAEAGKHVLCEKPLVPTLAELDQVEAAAKANKVTIFEAFMYLHHPQTFKVREMVQAGQLGELQLINSSFAWYLSPENSTNIRLSPELAGGSLWDVGVYPNSLAITLAGTGAPLEVWASQIKGETGVDVSLVGQMKFANNLAAQISTGFRCAFREGAEIVGSQGTIVLAEPWKPHLSGHGSQIKFRSIDGQEEVIHIPNSDPYQHEVEAMEACVLDGAEPVVTLNMSRDFLRSILALLESAESGQPVRP